MELGWDILGAHFTMCLEYDVFSKGLFRSNFDDFLRQNRNSYEF